MRTIRDQFSLLGAGALLLAVAGTGQAQSDMRLTVEARGGVAVPTFDIADAADAGPSFGFGVAYAVAERWNILGDVDFGFHPGADDGPDVNVYHYMGKISYDVFERPDSRWFASLNAGAGAMTFDIDEVDSFTYFAINAGAKIGYRATDQVVLFLNPQGDIAFSDEEELGTDNAWVWPFSAGVNFRF